MQESEISLGLGIRNALPEIPPVIASEVRLLAMTTEKGMIKLSYSGASFSIQKEQRVSVAIDGACLSRSFLKQCHFLEVGDD